MATKDWNGFKKNGDTYIPNDSVARDAVDAITDGASINSFSDVETALSAKADATDVTAIEGKIPSSASSSNKMATASDVNAKVSWSDTEKSVKKNLIPKAVGTTNGGLTYTVNSDGKVTIEPGTATANSFLYITRNLQVPKTGTYILTGCPEGGSDTNGYCMQVRLADNTIVLNDTGNGSTGTLTKGVNYTVLIRVQNGTVIPTEKVYSPMLRLEGTPSEYTPYIPDNTELFPRSEQAVLGAKNLIVQPYANQANLKNAGDTVVSEGITWRLNADMSVTAVSGSGTNVGQIGLTGRLDDANTLKLKKGKYILNGSPVTSNTNVNIHLATTVNNSYTEIPNATSKNGADAEFEITDAYLQTGKDYATIAIYCVCGYGALSSELTFKPMIRLATDTDPTYAPYAMTNRELTVPQEVTISSIAGTQESTNGRRIGKLIDINIGMDAVTLDANGVLCKIPADVAPSNNMSFFGYNTSDNTPIRIYVTNTGDIKTASALSNKGVRGHITYIQR